MDFINLSFTGILVSDPIPGRNYTILPVEIQGKENRRIQIEAYVNRPLEDLEVMKGDRLAVINAGLFQKKTGEIAAVLASGISTLEIIRKRNIEPSVSINDLL